MPMVILDDPLYHFKLTLDQKSRITITSKKVAPKAGIPFFAKSKYFNWASVSK